MNDIKLKKIQSYLNNLFDTEHFVVKKRKNIEDSLEIYIKDEFLGLIYEEIDENEKAYQFHMTILDEDLKNE
jgi:hypothetical protein